ncbi:MAG: hypothetical protein IKY52_07330 [Clostridia bacterium]|nr:hypothetical protein [Clostridia bacterium]
MGYAIKADGFFVVRFFVEIIIAESYSKCNISCAFSYLQNQQKAIITILYFSQIFTLSTSGRYHNSIRFADIPFPQGMPIRYIRDWQKQGK